MAPSNFHHPYQPYPIQQQFMTALYDCVEQGKVGIFESPTGTGKSLSLICGSLTWLRDHKRAQVDEAIASNDTERGDEPDWMIEHERREQRRRVLQDRRDVEERLQRIREKEKKIKKKYENGEPMAKRRKLAVDDHNADAEEETFVLEDYDSDSESRSASRQSIFASNDISSETQAILKRLGMFTGIQAERDDLEVPDELKIFYCSRTHSQLSQFANELRRVKLPPTIDEEEAEDDTVTETLKHLTLGSRKNLCINPKVNKLGSNTAINERCLELQRSKTSEHKCDFLPDQDNEALANDFRDHAIAKIRDIEELGELGRRMGICPYYASRSAVKPSEIVTLPYPLLLQRSAREALDLSLKDHVVIIDEAHNLMDAVSAMYSATISLSKLELGRSHLMVYLQRFRNRLKGKNRVYVAQIVRVIDSLIQFLKSRVALPKTSVEGVVPIAELLAGKGVDQINIYKLSKYIQESRLARKVDGYITHAEEVESKRPKVPAGSSLSAHKEPSVPVLTQIEGFLMALMNPSKEGRFFCVKSEDSQMLSLQYMLLDPTFHFREIVEDARAVILAGGTMSPMDDYIKHLFSYLPMDRIMTLSCDHVIPSSNLLAWIVAKDITGRDFDFTFQNRSSKAAMRAAGETLLQLIEAIPDGVVAFFSSYAYLDACVTEWKTKDGTGSLWNKLNAIKPVFLEPRSNTAQHSSTQIGSHNSETPTPRKPLAKTGPAATEALLTSYAAAIHTTPHQNQAPSSPPTTGALLLSVINGSLSEGINFSDRLGRAVIVFGLPFPNPHSPEWEAKMEYIASKEATPAAGKAAAQQFYENATMRAVNQAVGRAIRHKGDYAAIYLVDRRYERESVVGKLPGWIRGGLRKGAGMVEIVRGTKGFFEGKREAGREVVVRKEK